MINNQKERIKNWKIHPSHRGIFAYELYKSMSKDENIVLICGDLGYKVFDKHREDFSERVFSVGASEQAMLDIAIGMTYEGKKPFVYSITNFLIYRPFETLRTYINHEKIPIRLCASGRGKDYLHDGISHWSEDVKQVLDVLPNIVQYYPKTKEEIPDLVKKMVEINQPQFISLSR